MPEFLRCGSFYFAVVVRHSQLHVGETLVHLAHRRRSGTYIVLMGGWVLVVPLRFASLCAVFLRHKFLFHTKTAFQWNYVKFHDIPRLTIDSILIGQFRDSVIAEITGPYSQVRRTVWTAALFPGQRLSQCSTSGAGWRGCPHKAWCNESFKKKLKVSSSSSLTNHPASCTVVGSNSPDGVKTLDDVTFVLKHSVHSMDMDVPSYCACSLESVCYHSKKHTGFLGRS